MSKLTRVLVLAVLLAAMTLGGGPAVAQGQTTEAAALALAGTLVVLPRRRAGRGARARQAT